MTKTKQEMIAVNVNIPQNIILMIDELASYAVYGRSRSQIIRLILEKFFKEPQNEQKKLLGLLFSDKKTPIQQKEKRERILGETKLSFRVGSRIFEDLDKLVAATKPYMKITRSFIVRLIIHNASQNSINILNYIAGQPKQPGGKTLRGLNLKTPKKIIHKLDELADSTNQVFKRSDIARILLDQFFQNSFEKQKEILGLQLFEE